MVDSRRASGPCSKGTGMGQPCLIARYSQVGCLVIQELELIRREGHEHIHKGLPPPWNIPDRLHLLTLAHWRPDFCAKVVETNHIQTPVGEEQEFWVRHYEKADSRAATFLAQPILDFPIPWCSLCGYWLSPVSVPGKATVDTDQNEAPGGWGLPDK